MFILFKKVIRELFEKKSRTILTFLAMSIGIIGFGSVMICYNMITRDLPQMHKITKSPSFSINIKNANEKTKNILNNISDIDKYEIGAFYNLRAKSKTSASHKMYLYAYEDLKNRKTNIYNLEDGKYPTKNNELLLERLCFEVAGVNLNDTIDIQNNEGKSIQFKIVGSVHDLNQPPANFHREVYGYISFETLRNFGFEPNIINIIVKGNPYNRANVEKRTNRIITQLESEGIEIISSAIPENLGVSPHNHEYEPITKVIQIMGIIVYVLATMLIINLISTILSKQRKQIGIIKTIGGKTRQIFICYFMLIFSIIIAALLISAPISIYGGKFLTSFLLSLANYDMINPNIPISTFIMFLGICFIVPLGISFLPILKSCNLKVKSALNSYGITDVLIKKGILFNFITKLKFTNTAIRLAFRNVLVNGRRVTVAILILSLGGTTFILALSAQNSMNYTIKNIVNNYSYDYEVVMKAKSKNIDKDSIIKKISNIENYEEWSLKKGYLIDKNSTQGNILKIQVPPENNNIYKADMDEGRWFNSSDKNKVIFSSSLITNNMNYEIGDIIKIKVDNEIIDFELIGISKEIGLYNVYVSNEFNKTTSNLTKITKIKFKDVDRENIKNIISEFEKYIQSKGLIIDTSMSISEYLEMVETNSSDIFGFFVTGGILMILVGGIGLASTMSIQIIEKTKEIGMLKSLGSRKISIYTIVLLESLIIGITSYIFVVLISIPICFLTNSLIGSTLFNTSIITNLSIYPYMYLVLLILVISFLSSYIPARFAMNTNIKDSLAYE